MMKKDMEVAKKDMEVAAWKAEANFMASKVRAGRMCDCTFLSLMEVQFIVDISSWWQVVADAAMNIASSVDRRASAYIDALWIQKKAEDQLSKARPCLQASSLHVTMHACHPDDKFSNSINLLTSLHINL